jgi:hypothetical protein
LLVREDRIQHVHSIFISNSSVASRIGEAATYLVTATKNLPVRALSYKAVFSIPGKKKVDQLRLPIRAWPYGLRCIQSMLYRTAVIFVLLNGHPP